MGVPIVAIVGRPNVGKSTLFNRIVGKRMAIVEDTPGVTRDRLYADFDWIGKEAKLVDTGGIEPNTKEILLSQMREQAQIAIDSADVVILLTDVRTGVTAADADVATMLQKSGKSIILAVNKCDSPGDPPSELYEFYNLGLGDPVPISSNHGYGIGDLLDIVMGELPDQSEIANEDELIKVAIIGKPNAGKSTLLNRLAGENRSIVSDMAGTTRDAINSLVENEHGNYLFIDTAGIRRKAKVTENIEHYSVLRALMAIDQADVCLIVIDATMGFTDQDARVAGYAHEAGKVSVIIVNKWDIIEKDDRTMREFTEKLKQNFAFMSYVPYIFISAQTGQRVDKVYDVINDVFEETNRRIPTGRLNEMLSFATARVNPPTDKGKRLKIYYITQPSVKPPTFVAFVNDKDLFHFSYQRYIENQIRETFGLRMTPIKLLIRERG